MADALNHHLKLGYNPVTLRGLTGLLTIIILAIGVYTGMISVKRHNSGILTYGQAVLAGVTIAITTAVITAVASFIYCTLINPGYAAYMVAESQRVMVADGKSPAEIATATAGLQKQMTTGMQVLQSLVGQTVSGTVLSLITGAFVKSK